MWPKYVVERIVLLYELSLWDGVQKPLRKSDDCIQLAQDKFLCPASPNGSECSGFLKSGEFPDEVRDSQLSEKVKLIPRIAQWYSPFFKNF